MISHVNLSDVSKKDELHCFVVRVVPVALGYPGGRNY